MRGLVIFVSFLLLAAFVSAAASSSVDQCVYEEYPVLTNAAGQTLLGGYSPVNELDVDPVIELATDLWNLATPAANTNYYQLTCLRSAAKQIVSGVNYKVSAVFTETSCDKSKYTYSTFDQNACLTQVEYETENPISHECQLTIYVKPWGDPIRQIVAYDCNPSIQLSTANLAAQPNK